MSDDRSSTTDVLAAELVLGLLSRDEQAIAAARLTSDARFAAEVAAWEEHFGALAWQVEAHFPPRETWGRIAAAIEARKASQSRWPRASMAMVGAAALLMLTVLVWPSPEARRAPKLAVATLVGPDLVVGARYAAKSGRMRVEIAGALPGPGRPELWILRPGMAPVSLGQLAPQGRSEMIMPRALRPLVQSGSEFAITIEAPSTTPHLRPSGPPLARGAIIFV